MVLVQVLDETKQKRVLQNNKREFGKKKESANHGGREGAALERGGAREAESFGLAA
jgi:hypothetical protein